MRIYFAILSILVMTGCSAPRTLYSPDANKTLTQVKILPGSGDRTRGTICKNNEWQSLHTETVGRGPLHFDPTNFSKTIPEALVELPVNEPLVLAYSSQWTTGAGSNAASNSCTAAFIVELKENHTYKLSGSLIKQRKCQYKLIEVDSIGNELPVKLIPNFVPCDKVASTKNLYEANKLYALQIFNAQNKK